MFMAIRDVPVALYEKGYKYFGSTAKMYFQHPESKTKVTLISAGIPIGNILVEKYDETDGQRIFHKDIGKIKSRKAMENFLTLLDTPQ